MTDWASTHIDLAVVVLVGLLLGAAWVIWMAQKRADFDFATMLRDDNGKESAVNMAILGSFAISSWVIMHDTLASTLTDSQLGWYLGIWSGARVVIIAAQKWNGTLPWSK